MTAPTPLRIALVAPDLRGRSGWSRYAADLGKALAARGHEIHAIVHESTDVAWCTEYPVLRPAVHELSPLAAAFDAPRFRRTLRRIRPDVVHLTAEPYAIPLTFAGKPPWPTVLTVHGTYAVAGLKTRGLTRIATACAYRAVDRVLAVSAFTKGYLKSADPALFESTGLAAKTHVLPNAVDLARAGTPGGRDPKIKRILAVGAVKSRKGYLEALEACAAFRARCATPFRYEIIGDASEDPAYVRRLRDRIAALDMEHTVMLRGTVGEEELRRAYAEADLFLLLSLHDGLSVEGFGLVFLEANAWSVPVVGPTTGGCPEAIAEGKSGFVCDPADADAVAERMERVLMKRAIDPAACRRWAEEHRIERGAEALETHYREVIAARKRS